MQAILFFFFFVRVRQKGVVIPGVPAETVETGNKDRDVSQRHALFCEES